MTSTKEIFFSAPHFVCQKWLHYFDAYDQHFGRFIGKPIKFLEIGVSQGGSLDMWRSYFGPDAELIGVDINPECRRFENDRTKVYIGDQADPAFLRQLADEVGQVDAVLDDGGHRMDQQILTFEALFPIVSPNGVYMCEDTHTSYDETHGGGLRQSQTFIEFMKGKIDEQHEWYHSAPSSTSIARSVKSISFYDSIIVLEKKRFDGPRYVEVGYDRDTLLMPASSPSN